MKITVFLALLVVLCINYALTIQVKAPTLRIPVSESLGLQTPKSSGIFGDVIILGCNFVPTIQILVRNSSTGLYDQRDLIIDQVTQNPYLYCGFTTNYETNGKLFYFNGGGDASLLFTLDNNYNAVNVKEVPYSLSPIPMIGAVRYTRDTLLVQTFDSNFNLAYLSIDFVNNDWKLTFMNSTNFPMNNNVVGTATDVYTQNEGSADQINIVSFRSRQNNDGTWPYVLYKDVSSLLSNQYEISVKWSSIFNGHDTISFATRGNEEVTGGMLYLFKVNGNSLSIDASFDMLDILDDTYLYKTKPWMTESDQPYLYWLNKDVLVAYSRWTTWADEQDEYFGIIILISRDEDGKWKYGGSIRFADGQRIKMYDMDPTLSDLVIQANDNNTYYNYFYPLCFMDPLQQVTCQQNVQLSSCDPNNPPAIDNIYSYTDDGCGEPEAIVKDASLNNNNVLSVNIRLERFGVKVGSCAATFNCPIAPTSNNNSPSSKVSSASLSDPCGMVISIVLGFLFALL